MKLQIVPTLWFSVAAVFALLYLLTIMLFMDKNGSMDKFVDFLFWLVLIGISFYKLNKLEERLDKLEKLTTHSIKQESKDK